MKINTTFWNYTLQAILFIALILLVSQLLPRRTTNFKYYFEVGKPWRYELLTAEHDFPVYKTEAQLEQEKTQVLKNYIPCYKLMNETGNLQLQQLFEQEQAETLSDKQREYLQQQFASVYDKGIIAAAELQNLQSAGYKKINLVNLQHEAISQPLTAFYTPKSAYDYIMDNAPIFSGGRLKNMEINLFLVPNLQFDTLTSNQLRESLLASISLTEGVVQKGERIIGKGEIVTEDTYQVLNSLRIESDEKDEDLKQARWSRFGYILLVCLFIGMLALYLYIFRRRYCTIRNIFFICLLIALLTLMSALVLRFTSISIYIIPFAWIPVLVRIFFDSRTAFQVHLSAILLAALVVDAPYEFVVIQLAVGIVAVSGLKDLAQRSQLALVTVYIFITYLLVYTAYTLATTGDWHLIDPWQYVWFIGNALMMLLTYGLIYLCEKGFGFVSSLTLVELTNVNNQLLLQFAEVAPGTFQHSLQVSNLATEAAKKIGADSLLVRAGALYHDIGKMSNPHFFTENQTDGVNPLLQMSEEAAAQVIIAHTAEGLKLAKHHNLPKVIGQFIASHHGTSKVRYFYNNWCNNHPGEKPDETKFCYPGPKPQNKETAILMMADAVEARSRSMSVYTEEAISEMVEQMVGTQVAEGQLAETNLSFKNVEDIKAVFKERLIQMNHHRIAYPELKFGEN